MARVSAMVTYTGPLGGEGGVDHRSVHAGVAFGKLPLGDFTPSIQLGRAAFVCEQGR